MGDEKRPDASLPLVLVGVGTMLTSMSVVGFVLGWAVDHWLETSPWFMLGLGMLGFVGGFLKVYKMLVKFG